MKWKWHPKFSENSWFPSEIEWYKNTRTGFRFWNVQCSTKCFPHPLTIRISVGGVYLCDITNTGKLLCSPNEPFVVVLEKGFFKNEISPCGVDFEICNFVDRFMPKHTQYTLTKIQKVKKHNRTPLKVCFDLTDWSVFEAAATDLDELTETVTSYISFCEDMCIPTRTHLTYNNDKPWFTAKLKTAPSGQRRCLQEGG